MLSNSSSFLRSGSYGKMKVVLRCYFSPEAPQVMWEFEGRRFLCFLESTGLKQKR